MSDLMLIRERFGLTEQEIEHIQTAGYEFKVEMYPSIPLRGSTIQRGISSERSMYVSIIEHSPHSRLDEMVKRDVTDKIVHLVKLLRKEDVK